MKNAIKTVLLVAAIIAVTACNKNKGNDQSAEIAALAAQLQEMQAQLDAAKNSNAAPEEIAKIEAAVAEQEQQVEKRREKRGEGKGGNKSQSSETETTAQAAAPAAPAATPATTTPAATPTATAPAASQSVVTTAPAASAANPVSDFTMTGTELTKYKGTSRTVVIPNGVTGIGVDAFKENNNITSVVIPDSVIYIGGGMRQGAFMECTSLTSVIIGNGVTIIGEKAFFWCTSLTSVTIGNGVTSIGEYAFDHCYNLTSITLPNVTSIENNAFDSCHNLTSVTLGKGFTSGTGFLNALSLTEINVDSANSAYSSSDGVLYNKNKTTLIKYPGKKSGAFTIADSVTIIGDRALDGYGVAGITIPKNVTSIGRGVFNYQLAVINVDIANTAYSSENGVLYNKNKTSLIQYPLGKKESSFIIPNNVTSIGVGAFENCLLTSITIPDSVTNIGQDAFRYCRSLTSVTIPNSVTSIENSAFNGCTGLLSVTFECTISTANFGSTTPFPGDLRNKYLAGGPGTYTTTAPAGDKSVWTKK